MFWVENVDKTVMKWGLFSNQTCMIFVLLIGTSTLTSAQVFSQHSDLLVIKRKISINALDSYIKKPNPAGLHGSFFQSLLEEEPKSSVCIKPPSPASNNTTKKNTSDKNNSDEEKTTHLEILLVTEASTAPQGVFRPLSFQTYFTLDDEKPIPISYTPTTPSIDYQGIKTYVNQTMQSLAFQTPEAQEQYKKSLMIEGMVQSVPKMEKLSNEQISQQITSFIDQASANEEERLNYLNMLAHRLYLNYNDARNPGQNNSENNPNHNKLPSGNLSLYELFTGAATQNLSLGGVCNDISAAIIQIAQPFYPNDDLLAENIGTHFAVIKNDGEKIQTIDSGDRSLSRNQLALGIHTSSNNVRISKLVNGKLKEISVLDTQVGQFQNKAYGLDKPLLKAGANITDVLASAILINEKKEKKRRELSLTAGTAALSNSMVDIVVLKYETIKKKSDTYIGIGTNQQLFYGKNPEHYISYHLKTGFDRNLIQYVNPKMKANYSAGMHLDAMFTPKNLDGMGGALETVNRLKLESKNSDPNALHVKGSAQIWNSLGPKDWGATTGATSTFNVHGTMRTLGYLNFHLNQVIGEVSLNKPLNVGNQNMRARTDAFYQGSNVGQSVAVINGIEIKYPAGAQLYLFTGVETSDLKGYQTKHSLLVGPKGGKVGAEYKGTKGLSVGTQVQGIGSDQGVQVNATAKMQFNKPKKQKLPPPTSP